MKVAHAEPLAVGTTIQVSDASCSEGADRTPLAKLVVDGRSVLLNRRQAREALKDLREELSHDPQALRDAEEHIVELRKHVARLWWYGDQVALEASGTTPESARLQMATAAREIGMLLNLLDDTVSDLASATGAR